MTHGHRDFTVCSCSSLPVLSRVSSILRCSATAAVSGVPVMRNARPKARRRIAAARHRLSGCNHAPRPGSAPVVSTVTADWPFPVGTDTIRSSSTANSRFRQPMHVRTGAERAPAAGISRWITGQSTSPWRCRRTSLGTHGLRSPPPGVSGAEPGVECGVSGPASGVAASLRISIRQPVNRAANRAFCPSLPIARES